jgi:hypothetical protein
MANGRRGCPNFISVRKVEMSSQYFFPTFFSELPALVMNMQRKFYEKEPAWLGVIRGFLAHRVFTGSLSKDCFHLKKKKKKKVF